MSNMRKRKEWDQRTIIEITKTMKFANPINEILIEKFYTITNDIIGDNVNT